MQNESAARRAILSRLQQTRGTVTAKPAPVLSPPRHISDPLAQFVQEAEASGAEVQFCESEAQGQDYVNQDLERADTEVAKALLGIAETGSVLITSEQHSSQALFLCERLLLVLPKSAIVSSLADALKTHCNSQCRALHLITGPSRTADVEQTIQIGAHGPKSLSIMLT